MSVFMSKLLEFSIIWTYRVRIAGFIMMLRMYIG